MASNYPKPDGWQGGSEDFTFVRTLQGHRKYDKHDDLENQSQDCLRNGATPDDTVDSFGEGA